MYTVFKTATDNVIFFGDYRHSTVNQLIKAQYGYLCRKEVYISKLSEMVGNYIINTNPLKQSIPHFISTHTKQTKF